MKQPVRSLTGILGTSLLLHLASCYNHAYLQNYTTTLLPAQTRTHIEQGHSQTTAEIGFTYASAISNNSAHIATGNYYDFNTDQVNESQANQFCHFPTQRFSFFAAVLGKNLTSAQFQLQYGSDGGHDLYDGSFGVGVRLYRNNLAGRVFINTGVMNTTASVQIYERTHNYTTENRYNDLTDTFSTDIFYVEGLCAINRVQRNTLVNPFCNLSIRLCPLFNYKEADASLVSITATGGLFLTKGPITGLCGLRLSHYLFDQNRVLHTTALSQISLQFPLPKKDHRNQ